jgi:hypothetical protein
MAGLKQMTTLHLIHALESLIATGVRLYALGSELISVAAILWCLNFIANAVERTYRAGQAIGHFYYSRLRPLFASIDWALVRHVVWHGLIAVAVGAYVTERFIAASVHKTNDLLAALWVKLWVKPEEKTTALPIVHPMLALASDLETCTCKQLRDITGCRRKVRKAELVNLALQLA